MSCAIYMQQGELVQVGNSFVGGTGGTGGPAGNDPQPADPAHAYAASPATAGVDGGVFSVLENSPQPVGAPPQLADCSPQACEAVDAPGGELVLSFRGAEPNPVAGRASFAFATPRPAAVQLRIFDARGRLVVETREREFEAGAHVLPMDAGALAAGVYRAQLQIGGELRVRAFSVLR